MPYTKSRVNDFGRGKSLSGFEYCHQLSAVSGESPSASDLAVGEIAINTADSLVYFKSQDGTVKSTGLAEALKDGITYGRRNGQWVDLTSPANLQVRYGTSSEVAAVTPLQGEPVWDTTGKRLFVGDGATAGGILVGKRTYSWTEIGSGEVARSVGSPASNTQDQQAFVTLGPPATYLVDSMIRFEAEDEENEGASVVRLAWTTSGISYVFGGTEESISVGTNAGAVGPVVVTRRFLCTSSSASAVLAPSWRVFSGGTVSRQTGFIVATLL